MSDNTIVLITGTSRGIGKGLAKLYLSHPQTTVVAGVRDLTGAGLKALESLPVGSGSKIIVVKIDSSSETDAQDAISLLQSRHSISKIDLVIANAGIGNMDLGTETSVNQLREHLRVNTTGPFILFQATWPLLQRSQAPKFVVISSVLASLGDMEAWPFRSTAYGASKAALNYILRKLHFENPSLIAFPISPGWVMTDMGYSSAHSPTLGEPLTTVDECVQDLVYQIDQATREKTSGTFSSFDGGQILW